MKELICVLFGHEWQEQESSLMRIDLEFQPEKIFIATKEVWEEMNYPEPTGRYIGSRCEFERCSRCKLIKGTPILVQKNQNE